MLDEIAMLTAGIAVEEVILGSFVDGAGGLEGSDLVTATDLATIVHCQLGMGYTMTSDVGQGGRDLRAMRRLNPVAWEQIDATVKAQFARAKSIIQDLRDGRRTCRHRVVGAEAPFWGRRQGDARRERIASTPALNRFRIRLEFGGKRWPPSPGQDVAVMGEALTAMHDNISLGLAPPAL